MDPNTCLKELIEAIKDSDEELTICALEDLSDWLRKGGFMPTLSSEQFSFLLDAFRKEIERE